MKKERNIQCEYVYTEIDYRPLACLLAERFMQSKKSETLKDTIGAEKRRCKFVDISK